jgi:hypothetical protein
MGEFKLLFTGYPVNLYHRKFKYNLQKNVMCGALTGRAVKVMWVNILYFENAQL